MLKIQLWASSSKHWRSSLHKRDYVGQRPQGLNVPPSCYPAPHVRSACLLRVR
ncbi:hypothetical protein AG1IA_09731 [Rhizoctonia solani AG-1 IA]|uniref:Uncharacterized protein n=1 Tax=Thanatephorus cucumeris (strain AG1-IA) TaxID=983506 RepID=L8WIR0_THACA|nr:hypothetical protein AG1IA_09731 [Rhizoctonia solani AG-1 IA]